MEGRNFDYGRQKSDSKEGQMARRALLTMAKDLYNLYMTLNDHDDLPEWCHYKLATSRKDLSDITDYLTSKVMKMCVDQKMSVEDLRLEINNSMTNEVLEEGFGDIYKNIKGKLFNKTKKVTLYDLMDGRSFLTKVAGKEKYYLREEIFRNDLGKLIKLADYTFDLLEKNKNQKNNDRKSTGKRYLTILDNMGLKSKFRKPEDRKLIMQVLSMVQRTLPPVKDRKSNVSQLEYRIDFDKLNKVLKSLGVKKEYDNKSIKDTLNKIDSLRYEDLDEFISDLKRNIDTLEAAKDILAEAVIASAGLSKKKSTSAKNESIEDERVSSDRALSLLGSMHDIVTNKGTNIIRSTRKLSDALKLIAKELKLDEEHLIKSMNGVIKTAHSTLGECIKTYKLILDEAENEYNKISEDLE